MAEPLPVKVKRQLYRGDSRNWTHQFNKEDGTPLDLTGWVFLSQFRADLDRGEVVCEATCTVTDGPAGVMLERLEVSEAEKLPGQSDPLETPVVYWDLQSTDPDGNVRTWMFSAVKVGGDVSDG